ncbi:MAG: hypothetical protein P1V20_10095 [Verrucomicrobiales bacterium]|nr:hypothetical protein [Verrucomicrobiales bacterium]
MKKTLFTLLAVTLVAPLAGADNTHDLVGKRSIEMRPAEKRFLTLKPAERNPYAKRAPEEDANKDQVQNTEELAIRQKLGALTVTGSSRSYNGLRLLLGDILIERGKVLPQLIRNQTQHLKVTDVTPEKIVLGWLDVESGELTGKTMPIFYDVKPVVRYVLQGQTGAVSVGGVDQLEMGILKPNRVEETTGYAGE